jgi:hypothetical protein
VSNSWSSVRSQDCQRTGQAQDHGGGEEANSHVVEGWWTERWVLQPDESGHSDCEACES